MGTGFWLSSKKTSGSNRRLPMLRSVRFVSVSGLRPAMSVLIAKVTCPPCFGVAEVELALPLPQASTTIGVAASAAAPQPNAARNSRRDIPAVGSADVRCAFPLFISGESSDEYQPDHA